MQSKVDFSTLFGAVLQLSTPFPSRFTPVFPCVSMPQVSSRPLLTWLSERLELIEAQAPEEIEAFVEHLRAVRAVQRGFGALPRRLRQLERLRSCCRAAGRELEAASELLRRAQERTSMKL